MEISNRLNGGARFFIVIAKSSYISVPAKKLLSHNITSTQIIGLDPFTVYNVSVVAIDGNGSPFDSSVLQARTDESGEYKLKVQKAAPSSIHAITRTEPVRCIQAIFGSLVSLCLNHECLYPGAWKLSLI